MADEPPKELVEKFLDGGVVGLFGHEEVRSACEAAARDLGCAPPTHKIAVWLIVQLIGYAQGLASEWVKDRLLRMVERFAGLRKLLDKLIRIEAACLEKEQLRQHLVASLRGDHRPAPVAEYNSSDETLQYLWTRSRLDRLDADIASQFADFAEEFQTCFATMFEPKLSDMRRAGEDARREATNGRVSSGLLYVAEQDEFVGRADDLDFLRRFIGTPDISGPWNRFRWQLLHGEAGDGKSRLGLQFRKEAAGRGWNAGFLTRNELMREDFQPARWRPRMRTLLIVDYPAEEPDRLAELIRSCAEHADEFHFAVRMLLLERSAKGRWYEELVPKDSAGPLVRTAQFEEPRRLEPIGRTVLCELMKARISGYGKPAPPADELWAHLCALDDRTQVDPQGTRYPAPRPLFAAALAEFLAVEA